MVQLGQMVSIATTIAFIKILLDLIACAFWFELADYHAGNQVYLGADDKKTPFPVGKGVFYD